MPNYAVISEDKVINIIVADNVETAEALTSCVCVEYNSTNPAVIGLGYVNGVFEQLAVPTE